MSEAQSESRSALGLLGRKVGMTRIFTDDGESVPVTVLDVSNNRVTQVKTVDVDGYSAVQVAYGSRKPSRVAKPVAGHYSKAGVEAGSVLGEFRLDAVRAGELKPGAAIGADLFAVGEKVDVTGVTIGKGFAGAIKRHHFSSNRATHGNSVSTNSPGSIGNRQDPGRVFPGKRMAGHLGDEQRTTQNLVVARVDAERGLLLVRGAVPGSAGGNVVVRPAVKDAQGQADGTTPAPETLFGREYNEALVHQIVVAFQANARQGTRAQKDRRTVKHSTRKPWRQKGTGRARAGMTSSPIWRGGGRAFPNSPDENFTHKVNKKMYRAGMTSILSQLARDGRIAVVESMVVDSPKTKPLAQRLKAMGMDSVLIITDAIDENLYLASRNLKNVMVIEPRYADPLALVHYKNVVVTKPAIAKLEEMWG